MPLTAQPINCTLKSAGESSTDAMIAVVADALRAREVTVADTIRIAAEQLRFGVSSDEGEGDGWPSVRTRILAADILVFGTPIWLGQPSSVAKMVLERMDAFLEEIDNAGRMPPFGKVAIAAIVGNEDGAHATSAQLFQALVDVGWSIAPGAAVYWVGEAMGDTDFKDLPRTPDHVVQAATMAAGNAVHLAGLLRAEPYTGI